MKRLVLNATLMMLVSLSYTAMGLDPAQLQFTPITCPPKEQLFKNSFSKWSAEGDWKSDEVSFAESIAKFSGAQWQGVNWGQLICTYAPAGKPTFPIALFYQGLVPEPKGYSWEAHHQGLIECHGRTVQDCTFLVVKKNETPQNIYEELDFFKGKTGDEE
jgi:hypothetical protein